MRRRRALGRAGEQQAAKGSLRGPVEPPASCSTSMAHVARIDLSISLNGLGIIRYYVPMISSVAGRCRKRSEQRSSGEIYIGKITEVGHPREGTRQTVREGLNVVWVKEPSAPNHYIKNERQLCQSSSCRLFDQFLVQTHLEFCRVIELNLSQRP
jgi:hypothetical protein